MPCLPDDHSRWMDAAGRGTCNNAVRVFLIADVMAEMEAALRALRQRVHDAPALQEQLFALDEASAFIAAIRQLASSLGHALDADAIAEIMRSSDRAWFERRLP